MVGETELETLQRVQSEEPVPPARLRPRTPRDLQTICLTCLEKDPRRRYGTAGKLAEDLRRFRADEPIRARPASSVGRAVRWCRRNPIVATLASFLALTLLVIAVGSTTMSFRLSREVRRVIQAERQSKRSLWQSYLARAHAGRTSQTLGQRFDSLEALRQATRLSRELNLSGEEAMRLRDEAIAALALTDLRIDGRWPLTLDPLKPRRIALSDSLERLATIDAEGMIAVHVRRGSSMHRQRVGRGAF